MAIVFDPPPGLLGSCCNLEAIHSMVSGAALPGGWQRDPHCIMQTAPCTSGRPAGRGHQPFDAARRGVPLPRAAAAGGRRNDGAAHGNLLLLGGGQLPAQVVRGVGGRASACSRGAACSALLGTVFWRPARRTASCTAARPVPSPPEPGPPVPDPAPRSDAYLAAQLAASWEQGKAVESYRQRDNGELRVGVMGAGALRRWPDACGS